MWSIDNIGKKQQLQIKNTQCQISFIIKPLLLLQTKGTKGFLLQPTSTTIHFLISKKCLTRLIWVFIHREPSKLFVDTREIYSRESTQGFALPLKIYLELGHIKSSKTPVFQYLLKYEQLKTMHFIFSLNSGLQKRKLIIQQGEHDAYYLVY